MIAVTFAHPSESRDFVRVARPRPNHVKIFHTGVGTKASRERLEPFLASQSFDVLISSGFAGGVDPSLGAGDLLLAENYSAPHLLAQAREVLIARVGRLVTTDRVIEDATERARFAEEHQAAAVDMETKWIAAACAEHQIPMISLRAISDTAAAPFPAPPHVLFNIERQKTSLSRLGGYLIRHPLAIPRLTRFARQVSAARASLTGGLALLISEL
jgi:adenosylhomocysteine nucleosidase